jgi:hypothetical protein
MDLAEKAAGPYRSTPQPAIGPAHARPQVRPETDGIPPGALPLPSRRSWVVIMGAALFSSSSRFAVCGMADHAVRWLGGRTPSAVLRAAIFGGSSPRACSRPQGGRGGRGRGFVSRRGGRFSLTSVSFRYARDVGSWGEMTSGGSSPAALRAAGRRRGGLFSSSSRFAVHEMLDHVMRPLWGRPLATALCVASPDRSPPARRERCSWARLSGHRGRSLFS